MSDGNGTWKSIIQDRGYKVSVMPAVAGTAVWEGLTWVAVDTRTRGVWCLWSPTLLPEPALAYVRLPYQIDERDDVPLRYAGPYRGGHLYNAQFNVLWGLEPAAGDKEEV